MRLFKTVITAFLIFTMLPLTWSAPASPQFTAEDYLYEAWFKVEAADLLGLGASQLVVLGRNYTEGRLSVKLLTWEERKLTDYWESPNLLKEGPALLAVGRPHSSGQIMLIILTQDQLYLYTYENGNIILASQFEHTLSPHELSVADLDGDGRDELLIVRLGKRLSTYDEKVVEVYRLTAEGLIKMGSSPFLGNIRCLAAGDLDGDGWSEVVTDAGLSSRPGVFTLLAWDPGQEELVLRFQMENLLSNMAFGMTITTNASGSLLYTADGWGRLNHFRLENNKLIPADDYWTFPNALVAVVTGDLDGDGEKEIITVGYPNNLFIVGLI
jgi:hypothetical protein